MTRVLLLVIGFMQASTCYASKPHEWQLNFQEAASPIMAELHSFHNFLLFIITAIVLFVLLLLIYVIFRFSAKRNPIPAKFTHNIAIEVIWTVIPILILIIIAVPSFRILKIAEHSPTPDVTIKVVGSQWYWSYSYPDHGNIEFDSNMLQDKDLNPGQIRLLEVDNRVIVPQGSVIKFLITASDVIHSFAIPSLAIKCDAIPGRLNSFAFNINRKGIFYGQCSELCGANHAFMPIVVEAVSLEDYISWISNKLEEI